MTEKLYDKDAYISEFDARVLSCTMAGNGFETVLDKTAFFPEEGGQSCDIGVIGDAHVLQVFLRGGGIVHITDKPVAGDVHCKLDWDGRFDRMQQHTGEHIVCGIVHRLYGFENVGFHLGADDVTFDFNGFLTEEQLDELEALANRAVQANLPVRGYYPSPEELAGMEYRSKKEINGDIRIVEIENTDRCACCAPHVARTGEVGLIKFTDRAAYKGGIRIHMACGMRALRDYSEKQKNLQFIAKKLSCGTNNASDFFEKYEKDVLLIKQSMSEMRRELISLKAETVETTEGNLLIFEPDADGNTLRLTVNALEGKYGGICAVFSGNDASGYGFAAASQKQDMRNVAAALKASLSARCGGSDKMIQGNIPAHRQAIEQWFEQYE